MLGLFVGGPLTFLAGILLVLDVGDPQSGPLVLLTIPEIVWGVHRHLLHVEGLPVLAHPRRSPEPHAACVALAGPNARPTCPLRGTGR
jgi:hypothetical protein